MLFTTLAYWLFLPAAVAVYYITPHKLRNYVLLAVSYFYYYQALRVSDLPALLFVPLVLGTLLSYGAGLLAPRLTGRAKSVVKVLGILSVLSFLFYFKYTNFFITTFNSLLSSVGSGHSFNTLQLLVPVGISVYTFQAIGYLIDVNNGKLEPERNLVRYALFLSFFPQVRMGPIARSNQLLPQFRERHPLRYQNILFGGQRFLWGLFKKAVVADWLFLIIENVYGGLSLKSGAPLLMAVVFYALMLYLDFSAYSDMALGSAKMMGFELLENFATPYFATNMSGFWKRWHMSLTSWLADYVFTPLVWSRWVNKLVFGKKWNDHAPHIAANLIIVFLVSGFWHGATLNFLIWGALQGIYRVAEEWMHKIRKPKKLQNSFLDGMRNAAKRLVVYVLFAFSLIFFRLPDPADAFYVISHMFDSFRFSELAAIVQNTVLINVSGSPGYMVYTLIVVGISLLLIALLDWFIIYKAPKTRINAGNVLQHLSAVPRWLCYIFMILAILSVGVFGKSGFIYGNIM